MDSSGPIARVRDARCRISSAHDNDTKKLLAYSEALQERYRDRLVRAGGPSGVPAEQAAASDGASRRS